MAVPPMCYVQLNCSIGGVVRQWLRIFWLYNEFEETKAMY